jgi:hypothetical protein
MSLTLAQLSDPEQELSLQDALALGLRSKQRFAEAETDAERRGLAMHYVSCLLRVVQAIAGPEVLTLAYGPDPAPDAPRSDHIGHMRTRLRVAARLFSDVGEAGSQSSLAALDAELWAISQGDTPRLLARLPGAHGVNADDARKVELKTRALGWERVLFAMDPGPVRSRAAKSRREVEAAYRMGQLRDWRSQVERRLGPDVLASFLSIVEAGLDPHFRVSSREEALNRMRADAAAAHGAKTFE